LDLKSLITHRFPIERAQGAYELITGKGKETSLGIMITYSDDSEESHYLSLVNASVETAAVGEKSVGIGLLGAGAFAMATLLPAIKPIDGVNFIGVCTANGSHARHAANKFGFRYCATDEENLLEDPAVNTVVVATRHHLHAAQVLASLKAGKHVFCEKPLCLTERELAEIALLYSAEHVRKNVLLMVGFNRRFAPMAAKMKAFLQDINEPVALHYRVNAGYIAPDHWLNDPEQGGGRIRGEICHFVDFLTFLAGAPVTEVQTRNLANLGQYSGDNLVISLQFANSSQGTISYFANGDKSYSKERVEVFGGGSVAVLEDFRRLELVRHGRKQVFRSRLRQDKGHRGEWQALAAAIRNGNESPLPFNEIVATTLATFRAVESGLSGLSIAVDTSAFIRANSRSPHSAV
jgi:predicted dehydrogenase